MEKNMILKNEEYEIDITDVSSDGSGVGNIDGLVVFVPGTVTGDKVIARILKVQKRYAFAKLQKIIVPSDKRCESPCCVSDRCGGCSFMHIDYDYQLKIKEGVINNALKRLGGIEHAVDEMIGAGEVHRYRNKMIFPVGADKSGDAVCGFYRERSHDIIPLDDCLLGGEFNKQVIDAVKSYMDKNRVPAYDEKSHTGIIRRIFTRVGKVSGEIMVVISANAESLPDEEGLVGKICDVSKDIKSVILNINKDKTNLVLGKKNRTLFGADKITDTLLGVTYEISPHSFYQVNPDQTEKLYKKALEYAKIGADDTVMDIYCGIGTISLSAAQCAKKVIGVEIVPSAIEDAKKNAKKNGIENAEFYCADAEEIVPKLIEEGERPDVVILDPPRKGSDENTLGAIVKANPERIVYVSCNPATLARDLRFLEDRGYRVEKVCGVDMFPNTVHCEVVCALHR